MFDGEIWWDVIPPLWDLGDLKTVDVMIRNPLALGCGNGKCEYLTNWVVAMPEFKTIWLGMIQKYPKISKNRFQYSTKWFASGLGRPRSLCAAGQLACHHLSWGYRWGLCTNDQFGAGEAIMFKQKLGKASWIVEIQHLQMIAMFDLRRVLESLREIGFRPPIWTSKLSAHCQCPRLWPISSSSLVVSQWNISENGCICRYGNVRVWLRVCLPTSQIIVRFSWKFGSLGVRSNYFGILKIPRTPKTQNKNPLVSLAAKDHPCSPSFH